MVELPVTVEVKSSSQNLLELRISGEGHTLLNMLVDELNRNPHVMAAYRVDHPLLDVAHLIIQTDGTLSPLDALREGVSSLKSKLFSLREQLREQVS